MNCYYCYAFVFIFTKRENRLPVYKRTVSNHAYKLNEFIGKEELICWQRVCVSEAIDHAQCHIECIKRFTVAFIES